tara:strand:- start:623 stop:1078 length:456 start_codon:yes stop_codon:yes gene_type:complete
MAIKYADGSQSSEGRIIRILEYKTNNRLETSSASFQNTNLVGTITPLSASNHIYIKVHGDCNTNDNTNSMFLTIMRGSTNLGNGDGGLINHYNAHRLHSSVNMGVIDDSHGVTSQLTYRVAIRKAAGYGNVEFPVNNNSMFAYMTLMEIAH